MNECLHRSAAALSRPSDRAAFTLLEALLSLSLSVVLMGLVGFAIQFYARDMNVADEEVRQIQLVTAIMQMIEDDLRCVVHPEPADTAGLESLMAAFAGGDASAAAAGGTGETESDDALLTDDTSLLTDESLASTDLAIGTAVLETPGLIGNQGQIQFDVSRLPRLEEYVQMLDSSPSDLDDVPSDIKTVAYFIQAPGTVSGVSDDLNELVQDFVEQDETAGGGLVRRSLDRAASSYAMLSGGVSGLNATGDLIAPEIQSLQFEYWDGFMWQIEWSSDEMGELPLAIRVTLALATETTDAAVAATDEPQMFQHVIRLPMAKPIEEEEEDLLMETTL
ncbi:prepilin-type cleavage/methylation domain-containing protein [Crateriforma conspicua]|uniref:Pseudopilin GspJ n=1 Tax=Crateriforma conspicua TaxID=2527996 RepID=A0A5C6FTY2_9PLAN|nr:prepilin-type cleavage/methylation domain-containing protein [Crateriforma conspicua]TWU65744.1 hypothetical protein V7x_12930 [Crateriforma conspicua]